MTLLEKARKALRLTTEVFDEEINDSISAAAYDLGIAGVENLDTCDPLIQRAVLTFVRLNWPGVPEGEYAKLKASYDEQKAQLQTATGYTDWGDAY